MNERKDFDPLHINNDQPKPPAALSGGKMSIADMYDDYLKLMKLDKRKMPPFQIQETKRAFYGAIGQLIIFFQEGLVKMSEEQGAEAMSDLTNQVKTFFYNEMSSKRKN